MKDITKVTVITLASRSIQKKLSKKKTEDENSQFSGHKSAGRLYLGGIVGYKNA